MPTLDDVSRIAATLPGSEERAMTGGRAWFVRSKLYAWECHPWPSIPEDMRAIIAAETVIAVKVADEMDRQALTQGWPDVFLPRTARWGEPKAAFRLAAIDAQHLQELVAEAWYTQAPKYLRREFDEAAG
ncbi:MAG TPA: hypothetical protein VFN24_01885 [Microbacterium sp.]|nr:hypothetical protein [Microbacterium sp.]